MQAQGGSNSELNCFQAANVRSLRYLLYIYFHLLILWFHSVLYSSVTQFDKDNYIHFKAADILLHATKLPIVQWKRIFIFHEEGFQLTVPFIPVLRKYR